MALAADISHLQHTQKVCESVFRMAIFCRLVVVLRIRDVYSGNYFFFIPDIGSNKNKKRGSEKISFLTFFLARNFTKL
jgi:hypothetical protein